MPSSSTNALYNGSNEGKKPQATAYSIDRFLGRNGHVDSQRPPPGFAQVRGQTKAEDEAKARMLAQLDAFDAKFGKGGAQ